MSWKYQIVKEKTYNPLNGEWFNKYFISEVYEHRGYAEEHNVFSVEKEQYEFDKSPAEIKKEIIKMLENALKDIKNNEIFEGETRNAVQKKQTNN